MMYRLYSDLELKGLPALVFYARLILDPLTK